MNTNGRAHMHPKIRRSFRENIAEFGMTIIGVAADPTTNTPPFSYTGGLLPAHGFELIVLGLSPHIAAYILNSIHESLKNGLKIELGKEYAGDENTWANLPLKFELCTSPEMFSKYCVQAGAWWGTEYPVYQVVFSDRAGLLPGNTDYDHAYMDKFQPLLY